MSLNGRASSAMPGADGGNVPAPLSRLIQLRHTVSQPVFAAFLAGGAAGAVSRTVVSPLERLKILFQIQSHGRTEYKMSVGKGLAKMWRDEGWRGFMRGNGTNCVRIVPYSAVQFGSYNFYKTVSADLGKTSLCSAFIDFKKFVKLTCAAFFSLLNLHLAQTYHP